jgi:aryl-phospho-beta-D-glucosidase BglC (GH1 family)
MFDTASTPKNIDFGKNPELMGKKPLDILDQIVAGAKQRGLRIVLDRHRPDAYSQSEVWYTAQYSEQRWIDDWKMLATHYLGEATVVGFDLHNEPHGQATWGSGVMTTDWRLAAERAGNAVLGINPDLLIIVEGVEQINNQYYWWGGNLMAAGANPVRLDVTNHLVYSPHDYPASVYGQSWFSAPNYPNNLAGVWDMNWGYLVKQNIAPILIGEFGTKYQTQSDQQWLATLVGYIVQNSMSFTYWCWNPDSGDTGGILQDDWMSIHTDKQAAVAPALAP